jgi:hypothetical protein
MTLTDSQGMFGLHKHKPEADKALESMDGFKEEQVHYGSTATTELFLVVQLNHDIQDFLNHSLSFCMVVSFSKLGHIPFASFAFFQGP